MADVFTEEKRSEIMRAIKSRGNKSTELHLIQLFRKNNIVGWKRNYILIGNPDFVFLTCKLAIFVDGCFWHGHKCRNTKPASNKKYWIDKIKRNKRRDIKVNKEMKSNGWRVVRIWECEAKKGAKRKMRLIKQYLAFKSIVS